MKTEQIERYLTRQMTDEERAAFEQEMKEQPLLAEDVKIVAWTIEAIRERGRQEDEEIIQRLREDIGGDSKRYYATVAAVIGGVLIVAAMTAVSIPPLYQYVIKPIIERVFPSEEKSGTSSSQQPSSLNTTSLDSISSSSATDSINVDDETQEEEQDVTNEPQKQEDEPAKEEIVKEEPKKEEKAKEDVVKAKEEAKTEPKEKKPLSKPVANFSPVTKSIGDTKYTLTNLTGNSSGIVTAYVTMVNNEKDEMVDIGNFEMVAEGAIGKFQGATFSNGKTKFLLHKGETVNIQIKFIFEERPLTASLIKLDDKNTIHSVRYKNIAIQWKK